MSSNADGFISAQEMLDGLPTPREFRQALENAINE